MIHPSSIISILDDLIDCYKDEHVFKFLHLPVQSGSDSVLKKMNRSYTIDDFLGIVLAGTIGCTLFMFFSMGFVVSLLDMVLWYGGGLGMFFGCMVFGFYRRYKNKKEVVDI